MWLLSQAILSLWSPQYSLVSWSFQFSSQTLLHTFCDLLVSGTKWMDDRERTKATGVHSTFWGPEPLWSGVKFSSFWVLGASCYQEAPFLTLKPELGILSWAFSVYANIHFRVSDCLKTWELRRGKKEKFTTGWMLLRFLVFFPIYLFSLTFQSPQVTLHAFCPNFVAAFSVSDETECVYSILPRTRMY